MNTLKHIWHFIFTKQYRYAALFELHIGFSEWAVRRKFIANQYVRILRQNIVNANGYSAAMIPNLISLENIGREEVWTKVIAPQYWEERTLMNRLEGEVMAGKIVVWDRRIIYNSL